jgi:hypothetical protein
VSASFATSATSASLNLPLSFNMAATRCKNTSAGSGGHDDFQLMVGQGNHLPEHILAAIHNANRVGEA